MLYGFSKDSGMVLQSYFLLRFRKVKLTVTRNLNKCSNRLRGYSMVTVTETLISTQVDYKNRVVRDLDKFLSR